MRQSFCLSYLDGRGYFTFDLSVGPPKGYPAYLAELEYKGSLPLAQSAAGGVIIIPVLVANKSTKTWSSTDKDYLVSVGYRLIDQNGDVISADNPLTPFDTPIEPGKSETVEITLNAPLKGGDYYLEVDIVRSNSDSEAITWFRRKGSKTILIPISVR